MSFQRWDSLQRVKSSRTQRVGREGVEEEEEGG
jgi:hypothetical protein